MHGSARSVLCVPVGHHGRMIGILYLEHPLSDAFGVKRIEIVRILATQAAIAFENARLYDEMKSESRARRRPSVRCVTPSPRSRR
jgi:GAF domain-containing protein